MDTYGDDVYYDYSDPNYNLYAAHLKAAVITQNAIYMTGIWFNQYLICILFGYLIDLIGIISLGFILSAYLLIIGIACLLLLPSMETTK